MTEPLSDIAPASLTEAISGRPADAALGPAAPDGDTWLRSLPQRIVDALTHFDVTLDRRWVRHGDCALVLPVCRRDGSPAVLKLTWPHAEAGHEHLALRVWGGRGAVRLLAADPASWALLLEPLDPDRSLQEAPLTEACEALGTMVRRLAVPAPPQIRRVDDEVARGLSRECGSVPRRFVERARHLAAELSSDSPRQLVHADLHYANVLARPGAPSGDARWAAIDPKPLAGDPAYALWPALNNRATETYAAVSPRRHLAYRVAVMADAAGLDEDRARAWCLVRAVMDALWVDESNPRYSVDRQILMMKAMEPE